MVTPPPDEYPFRGRRRSLKAVFAGDVANSSGSISIDETRAAGQLLDLLKVARTEIEAHHGWLIGMPGDGVFALFESAVEAVSCGLIIQQRLAERTNAVEMMLRIGVHLGDILFEDGLPFGEALMVAARLQALADPGGILVSSSVVDAVSGRIAASFEDRGAPRLRNIPRRIAVCSVRPLGGPQKAHSPLDQTTPLPRAKPEAAPPRPTAQPVAPPPHPAPHPAAPVAATPAAAPAPAPPSAPAAPPPAAARAPAKPPPPDAAETTADRLPRILTRSPASRPTPEALAQLSTLLAPHVGPLARIIVTRRAAQAATIGDLIQLLEKEIPNAAEQLAFRAAAANAGLLKA